MIHKNLKIILFGAIAILLHGHSFAAGTHLEQAGLADLAFGLVLGEDEDTIYCPSGTVCELSSVAIYKREERAKSSKGKRKKACKQRLLGRRGRAQSKQFSDGSSIEATSSQEHLDGLDSSGEEQECSSLSELAFFLEEDSSKKRATDKQGFAAALAAMESQKAQDETGQVASIVDSALFEYRAAMQKADGGKILKPQPRRFSSFSEQFGKAVSGGSKEKVSRRRLTIK